MDFDPFYRRLLRFYRACAWAAAGLLVLCGLYLFIDDLLMVLHLIPPQLPEIREGPLGLIAGPILVLAGAGWVFWLRYTRKASVDD